MRSSALRGARLTRPPPTCTRTAWSCSRWVGAEWSCTCWCREVCWHAGGLEALWCVLALMACPPGASLVIPWQGPKPAALLAHPVLPPADVWRALHHRPPGSRGAVRLAGRQRTGGRSGHRRQRRIPVWRPPRVQVSCVGFRGDDALPSLRAPWRAQRLNACLLTSRLRCACRHVSTMQAHL